VPATLLRPGPAAGPLLRRFATDRSTITPPLVLVQSATSTNSTPFTTNSATFPRPVKTGNLLIAAIGCDKQVFVQAISAGFQAIGHMPSLSVSLYAAWKQADGTETTITIKQTTTTDAAGDSMWIGEFASPDNPDTGVWTVLGSAANPSDETGLHAWSSGITAATIAPGGALAFFAIDTVASLTDIPTYTNNFVQIQGALAAGGRGGLFVALRNGIVQGSQVETTWTHGDPGDQMAGCVAVFNKIAPPPSEYVVPARAVHPGVHPSPRARFMPWQPGSTGTAAGGTTPVSLADTATGTDDTLTIAAAVPLAEVGTGADALTVSVALALADTSSGIDALTVAAAAPLADTGHGTDAATITAAIALADTSSGVDALTATAAVSLVETGTGTDALAVSTGSNPSLPDTAIGTDALTVSTALSLADTAAGVDSLAVAVPLTLTDTGHGSDSLTVAIAGATIPGIVTGSDRPTSTVTSSDTGSGVTGTDRALASVSGSDRPSATVAGSDRATATVTS